MTLNEFKAWFEGYTEGFEAEAAPTNAVRRIKEKVKEINDTPITERIFLDRYWPAVFLPWSPPYYTWAGQTGAYGYGVSSSGGSTMGSGSLQGANNMGFNSSAAMYALGKTEAMN